MPGVAAMSAPPVVVFTSEPATIFEIAKFVEVACWSDDDPETVKLPEKMEVAVVEVARKAVAVGVDEATSLVPSKVTSV